jgi:hypothetical protein
VSHCIKKRFEKLGSRDAYRVTVKRSVLAIFANVPCSAIVHRSRGNLPLDRPRSKVTSNFSGLRPIEAAVDPKANLLSPSQCPLLHQRLVEAVCWWIVALRGSVIGQPVVDQAVR